MTAPNLPKRRPREPRTQRAIDTVDRSLRALTNNGADTQATDRYLDLRNRLDQESE